MKITHADGKTDGRYTVTLENTGAATPQHVARFCGAWLGAAPTDWQAWLVAADYKKARDYRPPA